MDTDSEYVSVTQLAEILSISASRVRKLVSSGRIIGAFKVGCTWMIRLVQGMPQIIKGRRGPDLTFKNKAPKAKKKIYKKHDGSLKAPAFKEGMKNDPDGFNRPFNLPSCQAMFILTDVTFSE
jgi:Helix-turn-helix domain